MVEQLDHRVADESGRGLVAGHQQQDEHADHLVVAQLRALDLGLHQPGEEILARSPAPFVGESREVLPHLADQASQLAQALRRRRHEEAVPEVGDRGVGPRLELLAVLGRDTDDLGDDDDRQRIGERPHEVDLACVESPVDQLVGDLAHARLEAADDTRGEGLVHQAAQPRVLRRILAEHARFGDLLRIDTRWCGKTARPRLRVLQDRLHVRVAEDGHDRQLGVAEGGVVAPAAGVERKRVASRLRIEGIECEVYRHARLFAAVRFYVPPRRSVKRVFCSRTSGSISSEYSRRQLRKIEASSFDRPQRHASAARLSARPLQAVVRLLIASGSESLSASGSIPTTKYSAGASRDCVAASTELRQHGRSSLI